MSRTGWTVAAVAGVVVLVAAGLELATRKSTQSASRPPRAAPMRPPAANSEKPPAPAPGAENPVTGKPEVGAGGPDEVDGLRTLEIDLYFLRPDGQGLSPERREIFATAALLDQLKQTVNALIRGPGAGSPLDPVLPAGTPLRDLYLDERGTLYIDFGQELVGRMLSGSTAEIFAAGSLANTLVLNFPEVRAVRILVAGDEIRTLGGHLDLSRPLAADRELIVPWIEREEWWWPGWLAARIIETRDGDVLSSVAPEGDAP